MTIPSTKFKQLLTSHHRMDRQTILNTLNRWLQDKCSDPKICAFSNWLSTLSGNNSWMSEEQFKDSSHWMWMMASSFDDLDVFQQIVKHTLGIPPNYTRVPRRKISKKMREKVWIHQFGDTLKGTCDCCNIGFMYGDNNWRVHPIVPSTNELTNMRIVCASCKRNENTDNFRQRCYNQFSSTQVIPNDNVADILLNTH